MYLIFLVQHTMLLSLVLSKLQILVYNLFSVMNIL